MEKQSAVCVVVLALHMIAASCNPTVPVPAFLWSNDPSRSLNYEEGSIDYNIISSGDLAKNVLRTAGWSELLCSRTKRDQAAEVALVFIGNNLHSSDISHKRDTDAELIELLKASLKESKFSMAFPYVALSGDGGTLANSLLSGFMENCDHALTSEIAVLAPCSLDGVDIKKLPDLDSFNDYVSARKEQRAGRDTDLIFVCSDKSSAIEASQSTQLESKFLSKILMDLRQSGITYSVLYTSDPYEIVPHLRSEKLERHLLPNVMGNASANATFCDAECQSKASILEGLFVGLILLIILLFGLKCMMGIETPSRFEAPHES